MLPYLKKFMLELVMLVKQHNIIIIPLKKPIKLSLLPENPYIYKNDSPTQLAKTMVCRYFLQCALEQWYSGMSLQDI